MDPIPLPPPVGGINEKVPLFSLQAPACQTLTNWNVDSTVVSIRRGDSLYAENTTTANVVILALSNWGANQILVMTQNSATLEVILWQISGGGVITNILAFIAPSAISAHGTGFFRGNSYFFTTVAGCSVRYDGTVPVVLAYTIGGAPVSVNGGSCAYKNRHYMPKASSASYYYSGVDLVSGATTEGDLSSLLAAQAFLTQIATFTLSNQSGAQQILAFIFDSGDILFYSGDYPAAANWSLVGAAKIGAPYQLDSGGNYQGDYLIATQQGVVSLRDLFLTGSVQANSLTVNADISDTYKALVNNFTAGTGGLANEVIDVIFDQANQRLMFCFPTTAGRPPPNGTTDGLTFVIFNADTQSWYIHTRRYITAPTHCRRVVIAGRKIYYVTLRYDTGGVQQPGFKVLEKEGATIFADVTSGLVASPVGISFDYVSAPISNGRMYVQKAGGMDVIMKSDLNANVDYQMIGDFGVTQTAQQKIPASTFVYRKTFVNLGLESSFIQYRINGTTPTGAGLSGYYLYGVNFWSDIGRSPR